MEPSPAPNSSNMTGPKKRAPRTRVADAAPLLVPLDSRRAHAAASPDLRRRARRDSRRALRREHAPALHARARRRARRRAQHRGARVRPARGRGISECAARWRHARASGDAGFARSACAPSRPSRARFANRRAQVAQTPPLRTSPRGGRASWRAIPSSARAARRQSSPSRSACPPSTRFPRLSGRASRRGGGAAAPSTSATPPPPATTRCATRSPRTSRARAARGARRSRSSS